MNLLLEQLLNGLQYGITLFLLAAGLTLVFGIMGVINLAHGSLYMVGAFVGVYVAQLAGSFWLGALAAVVGAAVAGLIIEALVIRRLYAREHLDQVLATFALILILNQLVVLGFGRQPIHAMLPQGFTASVGLLPGLQYPTYRLLVIAAGLAVAAGLYLLINRTRVGMLVRAGATNREMVRALGVDIRLLYTAVFALGALLAGFAGYVAAPISATQVGMGEQILLATLVVVVVGGVGSIKGAFIAGLGLGLFDTLMRAFLPGLLRLAMPPADADALGASVSSMGIYLAMTLVLLVCPRGLFPVGG